MDRRLLLAGVIGASLGAATVMANSLLLTDDAVQADDTPVVAVAARPNQCPSATCSLAWQVIPGVQYPSSRMTELGWISVDRVQNVRGSGKAKVFFSSGGLHNLTCTTYDSVRNRTLTNRQCASPVTYNSLSPGPWNIRITGLATNSRPGLGGSTTPEVGVSVYG